MHSIADGSPPSPPLACVLSGGIDGPLPGLVRVVVGVCLGVTLSLIGKRDAIAIGLDLRLGGIRLGCCELDLCVGLGDVLDELLSREASLGRLVLKVDVIAFGTNCQLREVDSETLKIVKRPNRNALCGQSPIIESFPDLEQMLPRLDNWGGKKWIGRNRGQFIKVCRVENADHL